MRNPAFKIEECTCGGKVCKSIVFVMIDCDIETTSRGIETSLHYPVDEIDNLISSLQQIKASFESAPSQLELKVQ